MIDSSERMRFMREVIAKNEFYEIEVDREKNRSYSKYKGYWKSVDEIPNYLEDCCRELTRRLKPGYTTLVDLREFKIPPPEVMELFVEAQKIDEKAGFYKSARIILTPLEKLASKRVGSEANVKEKSREFNSIEEAEQWLDE